MYSFIIFSFFPTVSTKYYVIFILNVIDLLFHSSLSKTSCYFSYAIAKSYFYCNRRFYFTKVFLLTTSSTGGFLKLKRPKKCTSLNSREVHKSYSFLSAATISVIRTFHRRIIFAILEELATFGREELVNREIYAIEQVTRIIIGCRYPI